MTVEPPFGHPATTLPGKPLDPASDYFDLDVPLDGYRWWYLDVVSDDGRYSLVIIGFIGSVFSPYYASARRRGPADPFAHCALNAILYGPGRRKRWAMTERSASMFNSRAQGVNIGPSSMYWDNNALVVDIDERCNPLPIAFRGQVRLQPTLVNPHAFALHSNGQHHWWPVAPVATAEVKLQSPDVQFSGSAYLDSNFGNRPLERDFSDWDWTRSESPVRDGKTPAITYRCNETDGQRTALSLAIDEHGTLRTAQVGAHQKLSRAFWQVARSTLSDAPVRKIKTLEDTPFYVRSLLTTDTAKLVHESLDLGRFSSRWVQTLLPFRMPRNDTQRGQENQ
ncbi:MAG: carotenoid 1,2-hydratase [Pseudomonadota bacterium]